MKKEVNWKTNGKVILVSLWCVNFQVDGSVKKLLKGGRDIEDSLLAAVIRDLKIVKVWNTFLNMFSHVVLTSHFEAVCFVPEELFSLSCDCGEEGQVVLNMEGWYLIALRPRIDLHILQILFFLYFGWQKIIFFLNTRFSILLNPMWKRPNSGAKVIWASPLNNKMYHDHGNEMYDI